jgi:hypothetical protein
MLLIFPPPVLGVKRRRRDITVENNEKNPVDKRQRDINLKGWIWIFQVLLPADVTIRI